MKKEEVIHEEIYKRLICFLNVKFKIQLKGTGIYFTSFYELKNLITSEQKIILIINDDRVIKFSTNIEFYKEMISYTKSVLGDLSMQYDELQKRTKNNLVYDENEIFILNEHIGYLGNRLNIFSTRMEGFVKKEVKKDVF